MALNKKIFMCSVSDTEQDNIMKREFEKGNFIHVYNRGNKKMPIVHDEHDRWRFLKILRFFNDERLVENFMREINLDAKQGHHFDWPKTWPPHKPLVKILSYCLKKNHFHLILKSTQLK